MITIDTVTAFFDDLSLNDDFDTSDRLLWGYFFLDKKIDKLKALSEILKKEGYNFVDIFEAEKENEEDPQEYYLHIEKVEHHTIDSLNERNKFFYKLAEKMNVDFYDGFDVGNIITSENIV